MATNPFLGQLQLFPFGFAPKGWAACAGQLLSISQNQALFSLIGTMYGGDGVQNFRLPDLQGRTPVSFGNGIVQGQVGGEETHTLTLMEVPAHVHTMNGSSAQATLSSAPNNLLGVTGGNVTVYSPAAQSPATLNAASVTMAGGSLPHENRTPYLAMTWCIALVGIYPSRN